VAPIAPDPLRHVLRHIAPEIVIAPFWRKHC
jgi:hypothetical protein